MLNKLQASPSTHALAILDVGNLLDSIREIVREEMVQASQKSETIEKFYTIKETCEILKISESTFHRWKKNGTLRVVTNGGVVRVPDEEIQRTILNSKR